MLNIEKYKDVLLNAEQNDLRCCVIDLVHNGKCPDSCKVCKQKAIAWLLSEYKEPILDDVEKEYLSAVIKPFRKKVVYIRKNKSLINGMQYLIIGIYDNDYMHFPYLDDDAMYKGMEVNKEYSLEELGL